MLLVDELLLAIRAVGRLTFDGRLGVTRHPGALDIVLLVHGESLGVVEEIVHDEEIQGVAVDGQLVGSQDLSRRSKHKISGGVY